MSPATWTPADLEFVRGAEPRDDAPTGYSLWCNKVTGDQGWLSPGDVMRHGLTDVLRAGVATEVAERLDHAVLAAGEALRTATEPQEGPREGTEAIDRPERPSESLRSLGGYSDRWRWQKVSETVPCPLDTDGDGDCAACSHTGSNNIIGCRGGKVEIVVWAIDNKPEVEAWKLSDRIDPAPDFQHIAIPDADLRALAQTVL